MFCLRKTVGRAAAKMALHEGIQMAARREHNTGTELTQDRKKTSRSVQASKTLAFLRKRAKSCDISWFRGQKVKPWKWSAGPKESGLKHCRRLAALYSPLAVGGKSGRLQVWENLKQRPRVYWRPVGQGHEVCHLPLHVFTRPRKRVGSAAAYVSRVWANAGARGDSYQRPCSRPCPVDGGKSEL